MRKIEIRMIKKIKPKKGGVFIEGLPGVGLVGTIATSYIVQKLGLEMVGYVYSPYFPPIIAIHKFTPTYPMRLYYSKKENMFALLSEFVVPTPLVNELADLIFDFAKKNNIEKIISLGSITIKGEQDTVYSITSLESDLKKLAKIKSVELIKEGATTGVTAMLLAKGKINNFPVISLLAEAKSEYIDPGAASMVVKVLNKIIPPNIDTKTLEREAKELEETTQKIVSRARSEQDKYRKMESLGTYG
ncbi:proteasome assembly chaperone family protein [Candidatus Micrarchaeota archaeon]|nr:proteasome assembly chaperone family protein [Candidatus Micrarchaeota archaeon]